MSKENLQSPTRLRSRALHPSAAVLAGVILLCAHSNPALAGRTEPKPLRCQKTILKQELNLLSRQSQATAACLVGLLGCDLGGEDNTQQCRAKKAARCEKSLDALSRRAARRAAKVVKACGDPMPAAFLTGDVLGLEGLFSWCVGEGFPADSTADLEVCLSAHAARLGTAIAALPVPRACEILAENDLAQRFPALDCNTGGPGSCAGLAGNFSGVDFSDEQAHDVLDLANNGTAADLDAISGIGPSLAAAIIGARPFATIADLDTVSGVGAAVLTNLRDQVAATWCITARASCGCNRANSSQVGLAPSLAQAGLLAVPCEVGRSKGHGRRGTAGPSDALLRPHRSGNHRA